MTGTAESLNLAVAAGILLYEVRRRTGLPALPAARQQAAGLGPIRRALDRTWFWLAGSGWKLADGELTGG